MNLIHIFAVNSVYQRKEVGRIKKIIKSKKTKTTTHPHLSRCHRADIDKGIYPPAAAKAVRLPVLECCVCTERVPSANIFKYMNNKQSRGTASQNVPKKIKADSKGAARPLMCAGVEAIVQRRPPNTSHDSKVKRDFSQIIMETRFKMSHLSCVAV